MTATMDLPEEWAQWSVDERSAYAHGVMRAYTDLLQLSQAVRDEAGAEVLTASRLVYVFLDYWSAVQAALLADGIVAS